MTEVLTPPTTPPGANDSNKPAGGIGKTMKKWKGKIITTSTSTAHKKESTSHRHHHQEQTSKSPKNPPAALVFAPTTQTTVSAGEKLSRKELESSMKRAANSRRYTAPADYFTKQELSRINGVPPVPPVPSTYVGSVAKVATPPPMPMPMPMHKANGPRRPSLVKRISTSELSPPPSPTSPRGVVGFSPLASHPPTPTSPTMPGADSVFTQAAKKRVTFQFTEEQNQMQRQMLRARSITSAEELMHSEKSSANWLDMGLAKQRAEAERLRRDWLDPGWRQREKADKEKARMEKKMRDMERKRRDKQNELADVAMVVL